MTEAENFIESIAADVETALDRAGGFIVDGLKEKLSVPVTTAIGPRGGAIIQRSVPGEYPRMETKKLRDAVEHNVVRDGMNVSLEIDDPMFYAPFLQNMDRIVTSDVADDYTEAVLDAIVSGIEGE